MRSTFSSWVHLLLPQISLSKPFKKALKAKLSLSPSERPHLWSSAFISEVIWSKGQGFFLMNLLYKSIVSDLDATVQPF